jgi:hypothetical protein
MNTLILVALLIAGIHGVYHMIQDVRSKHPEARAITKFRLMFMDIAIDRARSRTTVEMPNQEEMAALNHNKRASNDMSELMMRESSAEVGVANSIEGTGGGIEMLQTSPRQGARASIQRNTNHPAAPSPMNRSPTNAAAAGRRTSLAGSRQAKKRMSVPFVDTWSKQAHEEFKASRQQELDEENKQEATSTAVVLMPEINTTNDWDDLDDMDNPGNTGTSYLHKNSNTIVRTVSGCGPGWYRVEEPDGHAYYFNSELHVAQYAHPSVSQPSSAATDRDSTFFEQTNPIQANKPPPPPPPPPISAAMTASSKAADLSLGGKKGPPSRITRPTRPPPKIGRTTTGNLYN